MDGAESTGQPGPERPGISGRATDRQDGEGEKPGPLVLGRWSFWILMVGVVTGLAGLLFGYDQGVISGALTFIKSDFDLSDDMVEVVTSWVAVGALVGALIAGGLADRVGRRRAGMLAGVLFAAGAILQGFAPNTAVLVLGRLVIGVGVGVASVAAPLYAAEMAPTAIRGRMVSTYQLAITIGIFAAYLVDAALDQTGDWRLMLSIAAIPGVLLVGGMLLVPESTRWLMKQGNRRAAQTSQERVVPVAEVEDDLDRIQADLDTEQVASWKEVLGRANRRALWVGIGLAVFQQVTGINAIIYYADQIFELAGFTSTEAQDAATLFAIGGVNVLATFIAIVYVDRLGRRPLLLTGLVGMTVSLLAVAAAFEFADTTTTGGITALSVFTLGSLVVFIASFAFSLGPLVWTVINEIYPNRIRGRAVALATAVNWAAVFIVSQSFLTIVDEIGTSAAFMLFAIFSIAGLIWVRAKVPETKGRSLEDIQDIWQADDPVAASLEA